jgi:hypothetical protein
MKPGQPSIDKLRHTEAEAKREADRAEKAFQNARLEYYLAYANWRTVNRALTDAIVSQQAKSPEL